MEIKLLHNHYDIDHLAAVKAEMRTLGAPTIRAYHVEGDLYYAVEGCHRLRAAVELGLTPEIDELEQDKPVVMQQDGEEVEMDWEDIIETVFDTRDAVVIHFDN